MHLLKGLQNKNIGRVSILTFEQFTKRAVHHCLRDAPLSKKQYERLLKRITSQKQWQTFITWLCNNHHNRVSLRDLVKSAPIAGHKWYWFYKDDTYGRTDIVDKTKIIELYRKTPTGELLHDTSLPPRSLLPNHKYEQAHVWETTRKSHAPPGVDGDNQNQQSHSAEDDGNAENKTILLTNGIVANWCLLLDDTKTTYPAHPTGVRPLRFPIPASTHRSTEKGAGPVNRGNGHTTYRSSIGKLSAVNGSSHAPLTQHTFPLPPQVAPG